MRMMPTQLRCGPVPTCSSVEFRRLLANQVGGLEPDEARLVDRAIAHNWTLTVIADAVREMRLQHAN